MLALGRFSFILTTTLFLILLPGSWAHGAPFSLSWQNQDNTFSPGQKTRLENFLQEVQDLLPPKMKEVIGQNITIEWKDLDGTSQLVLPPCGEKAQDTHAVYGSIRRNLFSRATPHTLSLNNNFFKEILLGQEGAQKFKCNHQNAYQLARATLIHELVHIYRIKQKGTQVQEKQFKNLTGFLKNGLTRTKRHQANILTDRSPDTYEFSDPEESFAVNMEYFLLDPEFSCRRPALGKFFQDFWNFDPYPQRQCQTSMGVQLDTDMGKTFDSLNLDPSRVYQIHYLHADTGKSFASKWGHAMFRIIGCDPKREAVGEECLEDINHHVVVSFRARMKKSPLSALHGVTGKFPSQMFLFPFLKVHHEYAVLGGRDLISLPIAMDPGEKAAFIHKVLENNSQYLSKYYFFSQNCATEADTLLKCALKNEKFQKLGPRSPLGILEGLGKLGLIDRGLLTNTQEAVKKGYLFPSQNEVLHDSFSYIVDQANLHGISPGHFSIEEFFSRSAPAERRALFHQISNKMDSDQNDFTVKRKNLAGRFFLLEKFLYQKKDFLLKKKMKGLMENQSSGLSPEQREEVDKILVQSKNLQQTLEILMPRAKKGYGIPLPQDFPPVSEGFLLCRPAILENSMLQMKQLFQRAGELAAHIFKSDTGSLKEVKENVDYFYSQAVP